MSTNYENVVLGSGWLYASPVSAITDVFALTTTEAAALVNIGYIESSAKLSTKSKATFATAANAGKVKRCEGDKEVAFETGIISWELDNVAKFLTGSTYAEADGVKTFTYANSDTAPIVFLRFIYEDQTDNRKVTIDMYRCQFTGELELDFNKKDPVTFDYAFDLLAKNNGTKNVYFNIKEEALA
ncbi:MAG: hypothetical protein VB078_10790 [Clostridiaceae bacterium]|nr:hypothetical protein [Clostridiaceae bacterium]